MTSDTTASHVDVGHRSTWMLLAMALPIGVALNFLSVWAFDELPDFILSLWTAQTGLSPAFRWAWWTWR